MANVRGNNVLLRSVALCFGGYDNEYIHNDITPQGSNVALKTASFCFGGYDNEYIHNDITTQTTGRLIQSTSCLYSGYELFGKMLETAQVKWGFIVQRK